MNWEGLAFQAVDGLASASGLFFVAAGLSLIFGVTRIVNIAHGSLYMLGTYIAVTLATAMDGALGFWGGIVAAALVVGVLGALIEIVLLRRIYVAPELFQLLATFALLLVINDAALWLWGPEDLLGPRAPGLRGAIEILGRRMPSYDAFLIVIAPVVLVVLHVAVRAHALRPPGARGDRGSRDARRARRQSIGAVHGGLCLGLRARRARRRAAGRARAGQSRHGPHGDHRRLRRRRHRRHGLDRRLLRRRRAHRRGQGVVHRHRARQSRRVLGEFFQADAGRRVSGHGRGADRAPAGPARAPAARRARRRRAGGAAPPGLARAVAVRAGRLSGAGGAAAVGALLALHAGPRRRRADRGAVRDQPAFHHGAGRDAFVRPRRLFRARRLRRRACCQMVRGADGRGAGDRAGRRRARRAPVRLVRRAALRRLPRDADARLRADRLVDRVPVAGAYRRLERRARHLAERPVRPARRCSSCSRSSLVAAGVLLLRRILFAPFGYAMRAGRDSPLRAEAIGIT